MATLLTPPATRELPAGVTDAEPCPSCGTPLAGEFCHGCGERRRAPEELSLRHSVREFVDDMFDVDSRALRSLRVLLFRPGELALEYIQGRRRPYLGPLRMYLTVFAVTLFVLLLLPQTQPEGSNRLVALMRQGVHALAVRRGMTDAAMEKALQDITAQHVTWLSVLIPLVFAGFLFLCFRRRRRWFGEHLVFATHFATINFLMALFLIPLQLVLLRFGKETATLVTGIAVFPLFWWMVVGVRRMYGSGWTGAVGWSLLLVLVAFPIAQTLTSGLALCTATLSILWLGA
ncbi:MAG: DUF3667 domain-containing protein [Longimicrobiaceae bacterium]